MREMVAFGNYMRYNGGGKQKCGSPRVLQHPETCAGAQTNYTAAFAAPHVQLYGNFPSFTRGRSFRFLVVRPHGVTASVAV